LQHRVTNFSGVAPHPQVPHRGVLSGHGGRKASRQGERPRSSLTFTQNYLAADGIFQTHRKSVLDHKDRGSWNGAIIAHAILLRPPLCATERQVLAPHVPNRCRTLSQRSLSYVSEISMQRLEEIYIEIREAPRQIHTRGIHPAKSGSRQCYRNRGVYANRGRAKRVTKSSYKNCDGCCKAVRCPETCKLIFTKTEE
jgi:hypothetical protein